MVEVGTLSFRFFGIFLEINGLKIAVVEKIIQESTAVLAMKLLCTSFFGILRFCSPLAKCSEDRF